MTSPCNHTNLVKVEEDKEKRQSVFKCLECGRLIPKDKRVRKLRRDLPVDDISNHMLKVHGFDIDRWDAVTGLET